MALHSFGWVGRFPQSFEQGGWEKRSFLRLVLTLLCVSSIDGSSATLPQGFAEESIGGTWTQPVGLTFASDGRMFVWEKSGRVWIVENGIKLSQPLIDIHDEVGDWDDFGLLGFALDPNFLSNGYVYLSYIVDHYHLVNYGTPNYDPNANDYNRATIGRITRYTAKASDSFRSVDPMSRKILLGEAINNGFPILYYSHGVGSLVFGADGTLLASCGEGASFDAVDAGSDSGTWYVQALSEGIIRTKENVGAFRSQLVDCLSGKILRMDPATGDGVPSNPFYDPTSPRSARSRVWALGMRNPCRMTLRPGTGNSNPGAGNPGVLYLGDVGYSTWEDLNVVTSPGRNFGWPLFEGLSVHSGYNASLCENLDALNPLFGVNGCTQKYFYFRDLLVQDTLNTPSWLNPCNSAQQIPSTLPRFIHTRPALQWKHGSTPRAETGIYVSGNASIARVGDPGSPVSGQQFNGNCSIGGTWYSGTDFPALYRNTYFHADYGAHWIKSFSFDQNNKPVSVNNFLDDGGDIVFVATHPITGGLYYISLTAGVRKISFPANPPPVAVATADKNYGPGPLSVQFVGSNSTDPDGFPLVFQWNFGDGSTSASADPTHVFTPPSSAPTRYDVILTVTDNQGATSTATLLISVNNTPPSVRITSPMDGWLYPLTGQTTVNLTADISDAEQAGGLLTCAWQTFLHHNDHEHPQPIDYNCSTTSLIAPIGCDEVGVIYYYRIVLKVTDPAGLSTTAEVKLYPDCPPSTPRILTVNSSNPASGVLVDVSLEHAQDSGTTSFTRTYNDNTAVTLTAPSVAGGNTFQKWQRDGADWSTSLSTIVTMDAAHTMTVLYVTGIAPTRADGNSTSITYSGAYDDYAGSQWYNNTMRLMNAVNGYAQFSFTGNSIKWIGMKQFNLGMASVYIDGALVQAGIDTYAPGTVNGVELFSRTGLASTSHTIKVVETGQKNASSSGTRIPVDYFEYSNGAPPPPAVRALTIASSNPSSGVSVIVSPNDNNAQSGGTTSFARNYNDNTVVTLTAPSAAGGNSFQKWQRDGADWSTSLNTAVTMDAAHTMTAVYAAATPTIPSVPVGLTATTASSSQINLNWTDVSNETGYRVKRSTTSGGPYTQVGADLAANTTSFGNIGLSAGTTYYYVVSAFNSSGESPNSNQASTATLSSIACSTATAGGAWVNNAFGAQTGTFTAELDATPSTGTDNAVVGLSRGSASDYTSVACIVRFLAGHIDARNGSTYSAASIINYTAGTAYHFRLGVNLSLHTYSIYVTPAGGSEILVGSNYAFRTEQNAVTQLDNWAVYAGTVGSAQVCNFLATTGSSRTLTVNSSSPSSGVSITVSPPDNNSQGNGTTSFTRIYNDNTVVTLTAPSNVGVNSFQKWQRDGADWGTSLSTTATMDAAHTMTVVYTGPPPASTQATFVKKDATTKGSWKGIYGAEGYNIITNPVSYPTYATASASGKTDHIWASSSSDVRALQKPGSATTRIAAAWYSATSFTVDLNLTDGNKHRVALYCVDWDTTARAQTIQILNASNNSVLSSQSVTAFNGGQYLVWDIQGHVLIRFTRTGSYNAVLSGLFFDQAPATVALSSPAVAFSLTLPLKIHSARLSNGRFEASVEGDPQQSYLIQASTNMVEWVELPDGLRGSRLTDPEAGNFKRRFYRLLPSDNVPRESKEPEAE